MDNTDPDRLAITQASIKALQWQLTAKDKKIAALERQLGTQPAQVSTPDLVLSTTCDRASQYSSDSTSPDICESATQTYALPPKIQAKAAQTAEIRWRLPKHEKRSLMPAAVSTQIPQ